MALAFTVRRAEQRDLESLGRLGAMLVQTHYAFDPQRFLAPIKGIEHGYASFLGSRLGSPDDCIFVAEQNGAVIGYTFAALEPPSWKELRGPAGFIHDVAVAEDARRSGVATSLVQAAIAWMHEHNAPRVILDTAALNEGAQKLFHRLGFRDTMIEMTREIEPTKT